jgi:hypothetical protein
MEEKTNKIIWSEAHNEISQDFLEILNLLKNEIEDTEEAKVVAANLQKGKFYMDPNSEFYNNEAVMYEFLQIRQNIFFSNESKGKEEDYNIAASIVYSNYIKNEN